MVKLLKNASVGYITGNLLNTLCMLLILPIVSKFFEDTIVSNFAYGMVIGQLATIVSNYSFSLTAPRRISEDPSSENIIISIITAYQTTTLAIFILIVLFTAKGNMHSIVLLGFIWGCVPIFQWQWYHITRESGLAQTYLLNISRISVLTCQASIILGLYEPENIENIMYIGTIILLSPWLPTLMIITRKVSFHVITSNQLKLELSNGFNLFTSSLLSTIYVLGPSLFCSVLYIDKLPLVQQFDRLRMALSSFTGLILSVIYPKIVLFSNEEASNLRQRTTQLLDKSILGFLLAIISLIAVSSQIDKFSYFLEKMNFTNITFYSALLCSTIAGFSNLLAITHIHPRKLDTKYRKVIFFSSMIFIAFSLPTLFISKTEGYMIYIYAAVFSEIIILVRIKRIFGTTL